MCNFLWLADIYSAIKRRLWHPENPIPWLIYFLPLGAKNNSRISKNILSPPGQLKSFSGLLKETCYLLIVVFYACQTTSLPSPAIQDSPPSWSMVGFNKADSINPILHPSEAQTFRCPISRETVSWESRNVLNPAAVVKDGKVHLFYRAQDATGTSRIGLAISADGLHFKKEPVPVFFPNEDSMKIHEWNYRKMENEKTDLNCKSCYFDGVEDPRIVELEDGTYLMTYTSYDGKTARLSLASSKNLKNWTKHGLVLSDEKYKNTWSKSGAIIARQEEEKIIATKINKQYWMYFGDTDLFLASSKDGIHWKIAEDPEMKHRISVLQPRAGYFDSRLVEPGPYALIRPEGILLIYNARNGPEYNDPNLPDYTYAAGQALFDIEKPWKLINRLDSYFIHPDKPYELEGEVNKVCFVEGMVFFNNRWFLYYGTADSKIAVAVMKENKIL